MSNINNSDFNEQNLVDITRMAKSLEPLVKEFYICYARIIVNACKEEASKVETKSEQGTTVVVPAALYADEYADLGNMIHKFHLYHASTMVNTSKEEAAKVETKSEQGTTVVVPAALSADEYAKLDCMIKEFLTLKDAIPMLYQCSCDFNKYKEYKKTIVYEQRANALEYQKMYRERQTYSKSSLLGLIKMLKNASFVSRESSVSGESSVLSFIIDKFISASMDSLSDAASIDSFSDAASIDSFSDAASMDSFSDTENTIDLVGLRNLLSFCYKNNRFCELFCELSDEVDKIYDGCDTNLYFEYLSIHINQQYLIFGIVMSDEDMYDREMETPKILTHIFNPDIRTMKPAATYRCDYALFMSEEEKTMVIDLWHGRRF